MLLQFAVENFRSFASRQVLSLLAVPGEEHPEGQVVDVPGVGPVLRSVVLYGANASGKSSLFKAFEVSRDLVLHGVQPDSRIPVVPHRLSRDTREGASTFEFELFVGGIHYAYGLRASTTRVEAEWLVRVEGDRDIVVFDRRDTGAPRPAVTFGSGLEVEGARRQFYEFVAEGTRAEQPLLAELRMRNATELEPIFDYFFWTGAEQPGAEWPEDLLVRFFLQFPNIRRTCRALLIEGGTGVADLTLIADSPDLQRRVDVGEPFSESEATALSSWPDPRVRAAFVHMGPRGERTAMSLADLSDGTRRLLRLVHAVNVSAVSSTTFIDELDRSLHTQLTRYLLQRLNASKGWSQFIFTTHDTNLLDAGVFGRDAIWFVERDAEGASHLTSLASFDRHQLDALVGRLEEGYLAGRFGAIPFIGEPGRLHWTTA